MVVTDGQVEGEGPSRSSKLDVPDEHGHGGAPTMGMKQPRMLGTAAGQCPMAGAKTTMVELTRVGGGDNGRKGCADGCC